MESSLKTFGYSDPTVSTSVVRGTIFDRNGRILAIQAPQYGFTVSSPKEDTQKKASILASFLSFDAIEIGELLDKEILFFPYETVPSRQEADNIRALLKSTFSDSSVIFQETESRKYPLGVGKDFLGKAISPFEAEGGIEELFNEELGVRPGRGTYSMRGKNLVLTIDSDLQRVMEETLSTGQKCLLFNTNKEILALSGTWEDDVLSHLVYSFSNDSEVQIVYEELTEGFYDKAKEYSVYHIYTEADGVYENLLEALKAKALV